MKKGERAAAEALASVLVLSTSGNEVSDNEGYHPSESVVPISITSTQQVLKYVEVATKIYKERQFNQKMFQIRQPQTQMKNTLIMRAPIPICERDYEMNTCFSLPYYFGLVFKNAHFLAL